MNHNASTTELRAAGGRFTFSVTKLTTAISLATVTGKQYPLDSEYIHTSAADGLSSNSDSLGLHSKLYNILASPGHGTGLITRKVATQMNRDQAEGGKRIPP